MEKRFTKILLASLLSLLVSCSSLGSAYTSEHSPRDGQKIWFTQEEKENTAKIVAVSIAASEMITEYQRAKARYATYIRVCYLNISQNNQDMDGGVRALNFIKKLHNDAEGNSKFWQETIELAKQSAVDLPGIPIPKDYR